jgi:hypothetical protein
LRLRALRLRALRLRALRLALALALALAPRASRTNENRQRGVHASAVRVGRLLDTSGAVFFIATRATRPTGDAYRPSFISQPMSPSFMTSSELREFPRAKVASLELRLRSMTSV